MTSSSRRISFNFAPPLPHRMFATRLLTPSTHTSHTPARQSETRSSRKGTKTAKLPFVSFASFRARTFRALRDPNAPPLPQSPPPPTHTTHTPARQSAGRWSRAFGKLTPGLALVEANRRFVLIGGNSGGGQLFVQRLPLEPLTVTPSAHSAPSSYSAIQRFDDPNLPLRQPIQLIHQRVNLRVQLFNALRQVVARSETGHSVGRRSDVLIRVMRRQGCAGR